MKPVAYNVTGVSPDDPEEKPPTGRNSGAPTKPRIVRRRASTTEDERRIGALAKSYQLQTQARRRATAADIERPALPSAGSTLADDLAIPREGEKYAVRDLHPAGGNSLLVAEKKAGKTTLALNLVRSLADGEPFLDRFEVEPLRGRIAFFNYELDAALFREWAASIDVRRVERVTRPLHLRGSRLAYWLPDELERVARWLRRSEVEWLIVDPAARAWSGLVTNENNNTEVGEFTDALDALKKRGGVANLLLATHTGRAKFDEGQEQSRGATRLEDWADSLWYLTKDRDGRRAFRANGRDVDVEALDLQYLGATRRLRASGETRQERRTGDGVLRVVDALGVFEDAGQEAPKTGDLEDAIDGDQNKRSGWVRAAEERGLIDREKVGKALRCRLTEQGKAARTRRVERHEEGAL